MLFQTRSDKRRRIDGKDSIAMKTYLEFKHKMQCDFFCLFRSYGWMFVTWCHTRAGCVAFFDRLLLKSDGFVNGLLYALLYFRNLLPIQTHGRWEANNNNKNVYEVIRFMDEKWWNIRYWKEMDKEVGRIMHAKCLRVRLIYYSRFYLDFDGENGTERMWDKTRELRG